MGHAQPQQSRFCGLGWLELEEALWEEGQSSTTRVCSSVVQEGSPTSTLEARLVEVALERRQQLLGQLGRQQA